MARLLVVEDDADLRDAIGDLLELDGFEVRYATTLADAAALLRTSPCDLVLSDLFSRGARFGEAIDRLCAALANTRTILLTAHVEARNWSPSDLGVVEILVKPFDIEDLLTAIHHALASDPPCALLARPDPPAPSGDPRNAAA